ncbi:MAG: glycoside hydrolase family 2 protein [Bacteroidota bacterium]
MPAPGDKAQEWLPATVPGCVHTDLMANGVTPDPFYGMNELDVRWVESRQWVYRKKFHVPPTLLQHHAVTLVCEGLDTFADIRINGRRAGTTANMFIDHRLNVKRFLKEGENSIEIYFDSPVTHAKALEKREGALRVALEPHRVYVRKAQYSFGWDWGPKLTTSGIWRSIFIEAHNVARVAHPFFRLVSVGKEGAIVEVTANVERFRQARLNARISVAGHGTTLERTIPVRGTRVHCRLHIQDPKLWWPNGYGDQPMYEGTIVLLRKNDPVSEISVSFALRTVKLIQEKDQEGRTFIISINGKKIFCKGADWIPNDTFLPRVQNFTYSRLLRLAADAHMNMLRVWGGGVYESDLFYETCDRLGLMVWQDFMFACGEYPESQWFLTQVDQEVGKTLRRLRNHPSIVVWCGNNECEWLFCNENPGKTPDDMTGALIFGKILPHLCRRLDRSRIYWRSSPFGVGFPNDESNGTRHQWQVWSYWEDFHKYEQDRGRFVAEFGFQAPANRATLEEALHPDHRSPQSPQMEHHNKQVEGPERLYRFQAAHHRVAVDFGEFIYKAQLVQAEALKRAVEHWRRRKFLTAGSIFWQLNDCWPVSSWAIIDSKLRPKAAYFYAKRFFAPLLVSFRADKTAREVWLTSDIDDPVKGVLHLSLDSFEGETRWQREHACDCPPHRSVMIAGVPPTSLQGIDPARHYLRAQIVVQGTVVAENRMLLAEPKHCVFPKPRIAIDVKNPGGNTFTVWARSATFVKDLCVGLAGLDGMFEDNYFDLDAGGARTITCQADTTLRTFRRSLRITSLV